MNVSREQCVCGAMLQGGITAGIPKCALKYMGNSATFAIDASCLWQLPAPNPAMAGEPEGIVVKFWELFQSLTTTEKLQVGGLAFSVAATCVGILWKLAHSSGVKHGSFKELNGGPTISGLKLQYDQLQHNNSELKQEITRQNEKIVALQTASGLASGAIVSIPPDVREVLELKQRFHPRMSHPGN